MEAEFTIRTSRARSICKPPARPYNDCMGGLEHFGMNLLVVLFFIGLAGSVLVILISFAEDITELFGKE